MKKREITLQLVVTVGATDGEAEVEAAINAALDEVGTQNDWGDWVVGYAGVIGATDIEVADDDVEEVK